MLCSIWVARCGWKTEWCASPRYLNNMRLQGFCEEPAELMVAFIFCRLVGKNVYIYCLSEDVLSIKPLKSKMAKRRGNFVMNTFYFCYKGHIWLFKAGFNSFLLCTKHVNQVLCTKSISKCTISVTFRMLIFMQISSCRSCPPILLLYWTHESGWGQLYANSAYCDITRHMACWSMTFLTAQKKKRLNCFYTS